MIISKTELVNAFSSVKAAVGKNDINGSRTDYLIKNGYLVATNGEIVAKTKIKADDNIVLPGKTVSLVRTFSDEDITIAGNNENVKISCNKVKNTYKTYPAEDYMLPEVTKNNIQTIEIQANELVKAIELVSYAIPKVSQRDILTGMNIKCDDGYLHFAGMDGYRVSWYKIKTDNNSYWSITIPKSCIEIIRNAGLKGTVKITFNSSWVTFEDGNTSIASRLLDGEYLAYERFFDIDSCKRFKVDKTDLTNCISRIKTVTESEKPKIVLDLTDNMKVSLKEDRVDYFEIIETDNPIDLKIVFNGNYVYDAVKNIDNDVIEIYANTNRSPFVFINDEHKSLILPVEM